MKIYVPSHKRPNAKLFQIVKDGSLNIIINHQEELEEYQKYNINHHTIICKPELKGLLDVRNWILDQLDDDWLFMMDDDIIKFYACEKKLTSNQLLYEISWKKFITKLKEHLKSINKNSIGVIGFNFYQYNSKQARYFNTNKEFKNDLKCYQAILLSPLLKKYNFKYEGYPDDGFNGQKAHCEDTDLLYFCIDNKIKNCMINDIFALPDTNEKSIAWSSKDYQHIMTINGHIWLLNKYKHNIKISKEISGTIYYLFKKYFPD